MEKKRTIPVLIALLFTIKVAAYDFAVDGIYYNVISEDAKTVEVTFSDAEDYRANCVGEIMIPSSVTVNETEYSVTRVGEDAFWACIGLTNVVMPGSIISIGDYAFLNCRGLTSVTLSDNLSVIGENVFTGCERLTSITIPESVTSIGVAAFGECTGITSITIPQNVTYIGEWVLYGCSGLRSIIVEPDNTAYDSRNNCNAIIETSTNTLIAGCSNTVIPDGIAKIAEASFMDCTELKSITISEGVTSIGSWAFEGCIGLTSVTIPEGVTNIGREAFCYCRNIRAFTLPESVTSIGESAFYGCSPAYIVVSSAVPPTGNIYFTGNYPIYVPKESVQDYKTASGWNSYAGRIQAIPKVNSDDSHPNNEIWYTSSDGKTITPYSFGFFGTNLISNTYENGKGILSFDFPVISIGNAFEGCRNSLTSITIPEGVTSIENNAFYECVELTTITIPESVTTIGDFAFGYCYKLGSISLPEGLTSIGDLAFYDCFRLTSITIPINITSIGESTFWNCNSLTTISLPEGITSIGYQAFYNCSNLTSITIPECVTDIGNYALYGCSKLTSITIPESVIKIGSYALYGCSGLESITVDPANTVYDSRDDCNAIIETASNTLMLGCKNTVIPEDVTNIANYSFNNCSSLTSITIPQGVTSIGNYAFYYCDGLQSITVDPSNTVYDSRGECNAIIETASNTLILGCKNTVIPSNVVKIGNYSFLDCSGLLSITIPESVTNIGASAFAYCSGLTSVTIPESVTTIGNYAFQYCEALTSVFIPSSVTSIGNNPFLGCKELTTITVDPDNTIYDSRNGSNAIIGSESNKLISGCMNTVIPEGVTTIAPYSFYDCKKLVKIVIPESVTTIGSYAFRGCTSLDSISLPDGISKIDRYTFYGCKGLKYIALSKSITSIEGFAFYSCSSLTSITIPESVTTIESYAFACCDELTSITIPKSVTSIRDLVFNQCDRLQSIYVESQTPPDAYLFSDYLCERVTLYVPNGCVDNYMNDAWWNRFGKIEEIEKSVFAIRYFVDGEAYKTGSVSHGKMITALPVPTKEGYTFSGWSDIPATMPAHNVEVTGSFSINSYIITYKVDGEVYHKDTLNYATAVTVLAVPNKEGYKFSGWSYIPATMPAKDLEVTGTFSINSYLLTVWIDGEAVYSDRIAFGTRLADYVDLITEQGIDLSQWEWYDDIENITMPAHDVSINAIRTIIRPILTDPRESSIYDMTGKKIETNDITTLPAGIYIRNGKKFIIQ